MEASVKLIPLGGVGEIGLNMMVIEADDQLLVVDCGLMFASQDLPGIDYIIPDFSYVLGKRDCLQGILLTHGHEDHIGGLPHLLSQVDVPVYGTRLTLAFVAEKLRERGLFEPAGLHAIRAGDRFVLGSFGVEAIRVTHSIADGVGFAIRTAAGTVIHTGDFKLDGTPVDGRLTDYARFAELGREGVLVLCSDSTNAHRAGHTRSEVEVGRSLEHAFASARGRIIVATVASHAHRIQQIMMLGSRWKRVVALLGRSMKKYVSIAAELGYIDIPSDLVQSVEHVARLPRARQLFLSTGSQGEMHAGLSLLAAGQHKSLQVDQDDLVIVSARVIPGNQREVARLINNLYRTGAEVMHEGNSVVHASGHASQADLQLMLNLTQPRYFVPVHGEYHHLLRHAQLAGEAGIEPEGIFVIEDGVGLEATPVSARLVSGYPVGRVLVEGARVGGQDAAVVRERNYLRREGALAVSVALDSAGRIVAGPEITTRGVVYVKESAQFFDDLREVIVTELTPLAGRSPGVTSDEATAHLRRTVRRFTRQRLGRSPLLLMVVLRP